MPETTDRSERDSRDFPAQVSSKERRKLKARKQGTSTAWFGLGMFGLVGWAVATPTVAGIFLGIWIDAKWSGPYSWTLMLLLLGLIIGCANAWYWVQKERKAIANDLKKDDNEF